MPTNKSKSVSTQTPGWSAPPITPQINELQGMVKNVDYATPIRNAYARAEQNYKRSQLNPLGAYTTADLRAKAGQEHADMMAQNEAADLGNAGAEEFNSRFGRQQAIAGLTAPRFYIQGATNSQPFTGGDALGLGASIGGSLLQF